METGAIATIAVIEAILWKLALSVRFQRTNVVELMDLSDDVDQNQQFFFSYFSYKP